ncbi:Transmembrane domain-containing protein [Orpheovirus IHUMI-LCC2]|uniref:Transmembrane domain-containing protein n=1 Tax=Orpheovirus IHUMI-LCC2 TaxID=2023057 RepID=A0A2I2L4C9_9VIRU|nr:Transmembrane domain-containing protein [Orpheovirus IHUMI-LCC2]SNW62360.1 Transmembrane domain-containing protein [Orpheovirus IHUMI-LCC2]
MLTATIIGSAFTAIGIAGKAISTNRYNKIMKINYSIPTDPKVEHIGSIFNTSNKIVRISELSHPRKYLGFSFGPLFYASNGMFNGDIEQNVRHMTLKYSASQDEYVFSKKYKSYMFADNGVTSRCLKYEDAKRFLEEDHNINLENIDNLGGMMKIEVADNKMLNLCAHYKYEDGRKVISSIGNNRVQLARQVTNQHNYDICIYIGAGLISVGTLLHFIV